MPTGVGGLGVLGARPLPSARPAHAALTLSRSSGCVQQAAPHEASPPKYQRDTRVSASIPGRGRRGASASRPDPAPDVDPDPGLSARRNPRAGFKKQFATRPPHTKAPARPGGVVRPGGSAGAGGVSRETPPRDVGGGPRALKRPRPSSRAGWVPPPTFVGGADPREPTAWCCPTGPKNLASLPHPELALPQGHTTPSARPRRSQPRVGFGALPVPLPPHRLPEAGLCKQPA